MKHITIKKVINDNKTSFVINAITLKNKNNSIIQKIPHPLGTDCLEYDTLEDAIDAITRAGFEYLTKDSNSSDTKRKKTSNNTVIYNKNNEQAIFDTAKEKVNSLNTSVSAASILVLSEFFNQEVIDILFDKIGEENELVRKNAINGICKYAHLLQDRIIDALFSNNWVCKNSAITCIANIIENENIDIEKFVKPLIEATNDNNTIIQVSALNTLALLYKKLKELKDL